MSKRVTLLVACGAILAVGAWYLFRPEPAFIDDQVSESIPAETAKVLFAGPFESRAHEGRGRAEVLELPNGELVLRLSSFETLNGPDLQVYLLGSPNVSGRSELEAAGFVSLGALKGNIGDQNYVIPAGTELTRYRAVSVWCRRFGVNFTTAALAPAPPVRS